MGVPLPLSFAAGFLFAFDTLLNGGAVVLLDPRDLGVERLVDRLGTDRVNALVCTPHLLRSIVSAQPDSGSSPTGGEPPCSAASASS
ncbi:hypothetical protein P9139_16925 [Curtobacterium flaccumfaciens]|nr:hypothetical protein P9139_16925 [Curtobacterium flaccumfaciens]